MSYKTDKKGAYITNRVGNIISFIPWSQIVEFIKAGKVRGFSIDQRGYIKNENNIIVYKVAVR